MAKKDNLKFTTQLSKVWGETVEDTKSLLINSIYRDWGSTYEKKQLEILFNKIENTLVEKEALNQLYMDSELSEKKFYEEASKFDKIIDKNDPNILDDLDKKVIFKATKRQLAKAYEINDFELYLEKYKGIRYLVAFSNYETGKDDFGSGNTEKYKESTKGIIIEEYDRNGEDIAENGILVDHKEIYETYLQKEISKAKENLNNLSKENSKKVKQGRVVNISDMIGEAEEIASKRYDLNWIKKQSKAASANAKTKKSKPLTQ